MSRFSVKLNCDRRERFLRGASRISEWANSFWNGKWYFPAVLAISIVFLFIGQPVAGVLALLMISTFFLAFCEDIFASVLPFFLMFLMAAPLYDTLNVLIPYSFAAIPFLATLVLHLLIWPCPILIGQNGRGLILVSLATLLGGCDVMTMQQASSPLTLYYSLGLGVGMLALYLLFRSRLAEKREYHLGDRLASVFYAMGIFAVALVIFPYVQNWQEFISTLTMPDFPYRNFCTTVLLVTLPATAYFARKHKAHLLTTVLFLAALLFTGSRSALLFGVVMAALCCIYLVKCGVISKKVMLSLAGVAVVGFAIIGINGVAQLYLDRMVSGTLISVNEPRWRFFICAARDFMSHPIFGIGLGNDLHAAVFSGVKGSMVFYHNLFAQVVGSMGLLGIIAYTVSITDRIRILRRGKTPFSSAMLLSYVGMLLISMTNPGGFCPLPNSGMMVLMISVVEILSGEPATELSTVLRRPRRRSVAKRRTTDSLMVRK